MAHVKKCPPESWEVVVWDGIKWFRAEPPICFESEDEARQAIAGLRGLAPAQAMKSADLEAFGLPTCPPDGALRLRNYV